MILLVTAAVGWLGWRLLSQEEAIVRQQARDRLERAADQLLAMFLRNMDEAEEWVNQLDPPAPDHVQAGRPGAIVVRFSATEVDAPPGELLYLPAPPAAPLVADTTFARAETLEFRAVDLKGASLVLEALARHTDRPVRAEALLRLARVQRKRRQTTEALTTYAQLADESLMSSAEVPYALVSRLARCQLLAGSKQAEQARREAAALVADLDSGRWPLSRESYAWYDSTARTLAGLPPDPLSLRTRLAVSETVESLWEEWQIFRRSGSRLSTKRVYRPGDAPTLAVLNASTVRMVARIYSGDAIRDMIRGLASARDVQSISVSLVDEDGRSIGDALRAASVEVTRSLSAAGLPWQLEIAAASASGTDALLATRRRYFVAALAAIVALVSAACYAMARGVLREAAAGRLQADFVSAVSHEFRSPLTTLRQLTELLAHGRVQDESRRRLYFEVLQKETTRLHQLVENLLDFGRMDAGQQQYRLEPLDLSALVRDGIDEYRIEAGANGHAIEISASDSRLVVEGDRDALTRLVRNLLENAVKYSPASPTVWVETSRERESAVLSVRDAGIGVAPEERRRIFEKFVRGDAAKKACIQGTGIGLALVKEIVRVHRGEVDVVSEPGRGSTFLVRLPLIDTVTGATP
jgi:signal transduction histidine kinase